MEQVAAMKETVRRKLRLLGRVRERMNHLGFPPCDPLYVATTTAWNAMHALHVELHYMGCTSGVYR
jgi:hypothetical protein